MVLFQVLLENLDNQHSRFVQEESFLLQHNIRRYKQGFQVWLDGICNRAIAPLGALFYFELEKSTENMKIKMVLIPLVIGCGIHLTSLSWQRYLEDPCALANTILWFLSKEKDILQNAELAEQVEKTFHLIDTRIKWGTP